MKSGILAIDKPLGITSAHVLNKVKRLVYPAKIGHMGTLDPDAGGVLLAGIGKGTRLFDHYLNKTKRYHAVFCFGCETDTLDASGKVTKRTDAKVDESRIADAARSFIGEYDQVPPNFSAKYVDGRRAYDLARRGESFTLLPRHVQIFDFTWVKRCEDHKYEFDITCGGGTFIRSLARDLAEKLGTLGYMHSLTRTACGEFTLSDCVRPVEIERAKSVEDFIVPLPQVLAKLPCVNISDETSRFKLQNGVAVPFDAPIGEFTIFFGSELVGLGRAEDGQIKIGVNLRD